MMIRLSLVILNPRPRFLVSLGQGRNSGTLRSMVEGIPLSHGGGGGGGITRFAFPVHLVMGEAKCFFLLFFLPRDGRVPTTKAV